MPVGAVADEQVPSTDGHLLILEEVSMKSDIKIIINKKAIFESAKNAVIKLLQNQNPRLARLESAIVKLVK